MSQSDEQKKPIPFAKVEIQGNELKYIKEVLDSGWLTTAGKTFEFEENFKNLIGSKYAIAVNSCTAGLHLALEALNIQANDYVICPSLTFTASAEVIRYVQAHPLFTDIDLDTGLITADIIENCIKTHSDKKIKAVIVVNYAGQSVDMDSIKKITKKYNIALVEDAAHSFPAKYKNQFVGSLADVSCFSFYANKTITTGEGGMVTTDNPQIAQRIKVMRLHGIDRSVWDRFTTQSKIPDYDIVAPGFKYNMPDINASIGLAQLEKAEEFRQKRQNIALFYQNQFKDFSNIICLKNKLKNEDHSWHLFVIRLENQSDKININGLIDCLFEKQIGISIHYKPLHRMSYYKNTYDLKTEDFPSTEKFYKTCVSLPIYPSLTDKQLEYISQSVIEYCHE